MPCGFEVRNVADLNQDCCSDLGSDPGHRTQDPGERVTAEHLRDLLLEPAALLMQTGECLGLLGDNPPIRGRASEHDILLIERIEDRGVNDFAVRS